MPLCPLSSPPLPQNSAMDSKILWQELYPREIYLQLCNSKNPFVDHGAPSLEESDLLVLPEILQNFMEIELQK